MAAFISIDPKRGTTTIRNSWRAEIFSEFGEDPEIKVHRALTTFDTATEELLMTKKDRQVTRRLSNIPDGQRQTILAFFALMDTLEAEDLVKEQEQING